MELKIKNVKKTTNRHGNTYYYDRISGKRINAKFGTSDFFIELEQLRANCDATEGSNQKIGTLGRLILDYKTSPEYTSLKPRTRKDYDKIFNYMHRMQDFGVNTMSTSLCIKMRDQAYKENKRWFANYVLSVGSVIFNWGMARGYCDTNPFSLAPKVPKTAEEKAKVANRAWTSEEVKNVLQHAKPNLAVAIAIGYFLGLRVGDVLKFPLVSPKEINGEKWIIIRQGKTGEEIELPVYPEFEAYLDLARGLPNRQSTMMVINERGVPYTEDGFRTSFFKYIKSLERQKLVGLGLTFHGLRHTVATELADAGAGDSTIQHALGHKSPQMAARYRRSRLKRNIMMDVKNLRGNHLGN